jgi:hypothetical protein
MGKVGVSASLREKKKSELVFEENKKEEKHCFHPTWPTARIFTASRLLASEVPGSLLRKTPAPTLPPTGSGIGRTLKKIIFGTCVRVTVSPMLASAPRLSKRRAMCERVGKKKFHEAVSRKFLSAGTFVPAPFLAYLPPSEP